MVTWPMFNLDETSHEHLAISVSTILEDIHYKDEEVLFNICKNCFIIYFVYWGFEISWD